MEITVRLKIASLLSDPTRLEREIRREIKLALKSLLFSQMSHHSELPNGMVEDWLREMREKLFL